MKIILATVLLFSSYHLWSQVDFNPVNYNLENASTSFNAVAIGDVNNDGLKDLVIGSGFYFDSIYDYKIIIYSQTFKGTLNKPIFLKYSDSYPGLNVVQIADLNNDKLNDIVIGYGDSIGIFYQTNNGNFDKMLSIYSGHGVDGLKTGDLNNDGLVDIAVCHWNDEFINIFTQNTNGDFSKKSIKTDNAGYDEIDIADLNGDGLNDIIFMPGQIVDYSLLIFYQKDGIGITDSVCKYKYPKEFYPTFEGIGIGDLNNDGKNDIVASYGGNSGKVALILQDNDGKIGNNNISLNAYDIPTPVEIADLNCDGNNEIIVGHSGWGAVSVYEKNSLNKYSNYKKYSASFYFNKYSMAIGDLNNDSRQDIVSVDANASFSILYNKTIPKYFSKIDSIAINVSNTIDIIDTIKNQTITSIDTFTNGIFYRNVNLKISERLKNETFSADSLFIRQAEMCNSVYVDTIKHFYKHTNTTVLSSDTIKSVMIKTIGNNLYNNIKIYPNPCADVLSFSIAESLNQATFELLDMQGRRIIAKEIQDKETISMQGINSGMYIYNLYTNGKKQSGKLIKK